MASYRGTRHWCVVLFVVLFGMIMLPQALPLKADTTATPTVAVYTEEPTATPTATPTLGPRITRTPTSPQVCPPETGKQASIPFPKNNFYDESYKFAPDPILSYLNTTGTVRGLKEALGKLNFFFRTKIMTADVTGDGVPEVILDLTFLQFGGSALLVFGCRDQKYTTLLNYDGGDQSRDFGKEAINISGIQAVKDMNGNGTSEIVYDSLGMIGVHGYGWLEYTIWEWDGQTFVDLAEKRVSGNGYVSREIVQFDNDSSFVRERGDGTYELVITARPNKDFHYGGSMAQRKRETIYAWNGEAFTRYCWRYTEPPMYIADAVMDGDNESNCRHFDAASRFYQQAIYNTNLLPWNNLMSDGYDHCCVNTPTLVPDPDERKVFEAYSRYRIIVLHAVQNQPGEAAADLGILTQKYPANLPGHEFAALADVFWNAYMAAHDITQGCRSAINYAQKQPQLGAFFDKYEYPTDGYSVNAFALLDDIQQICPFK